MKENISFHENNSQECMTETRNTQRISRLQI